MEKLKSIYDFFSLRDRLKMDQDPNIPTLVIPAGTCGQASGANDLIRITKRELLEKKMTEKIHLRITGCHGFCQMEPSVLIEPWETFYPRVSVKDMVRIIGAVARGEVLRDLLFLDQETDQPIERQGDIPFFRKQVRTLLHRNEKIDPIRIFNYIENDGYLAMTKALSTGNPLQVIEEVKASGLRGRGGAGFPTGLKWEMLAKQSSQNGKFLFAMPMRAIRAHTWIAV
jgi:NADH-quinone oxidoreductase subunit F